ncbi:MAG: molybdopterin-dependent oxidoreductase [Acidimicrobiales bacterium]
MKVASPIRTVVAARDDALESPVHDDRTAAILGIALGVAFLTCFVTGLYSHLLQHPIVWLHPPTRPTWLYRASQGLHVATGIATIPLLLAKLWSVFPKLFRWPIVEGPAHALERALLVPLVCGSVFMLFTGVENIFRWYPWPFFFPRGHYSVAWITIGALVAHLGAKMATTRRALRRDPGPGAQVVVMPLKQGALGRRGFLAAAGGAAGLLTLTTVGETVTPLRRFILFAQRTPDAGSQDLPVNRAAADAGIEEMATAASYRLAVTGNVGRELALSVAEIEAMATTQATLPISCVEGWSKSAHWQGTRLIDLLRAAAVPDDQPVEVTVESLEPNGLYSTSVLDDRQSRDVDTLIATHLNGERLDLDHGYPCRLIAPNRPGVLQTKWVGALVVR